jgi:hypothetical protein
MSRKSYQPSHLENKDSSEPLNSAIHSLVHTTERNVFPNFSILSHGENEGGTYQI